MKNSQVGQFLMWAVALLSATIADYFARPVVEFMVQDELISQAITMIVDGAVAMAVLSLGAAFWTQLGDHLSKPIHIPFTRHPH